MNENDKQEKINEENKKSHSAHGQKKKIKNSTGMSHEEKNKDMTEVKMKLAETEEKLNEFQDKYLRLSAEFDNYRKRTIRERADLLRNAGEDSLTRILPVLDDFDRALKSMENSKDIEAFREGINLIYNKFRDTLTQQGIKEIDAYSKEFDTDLHEAITKVPAQDENLKGKVLDVIEKGYYLNDKVIRFAKVIVGE